MSAWAARLRGDVAGALAAIRVVRGALGATTAARVLAHVAWQQARGEPWRALPPPVDERDRRSRAQLGGAVLLYRALGPPLGPVAARAAVAEVVEAGGVAFLAATVPPRRADDLAAMARSLVPRFFNADGEVTEPSPGRVHYTVSRCRFVELLAAVGASELAPLACAVDHAYFARHPHVALERPTTIAGGAARCEFRFTPR